MKELLRNIIKAVTGDNTYSDLYDLYNKYGSCEFVECFEKALVIFKGHSRYEKALKAYDDIMENEEMLAILF